MDKLQINNGMSRSLPAFSTSYLRLFRDIFADKGINFNAWLEDACIDVNLVDEPFSFLSFEELDKMLNSTLLDEAFYELGLDVGKNLTISSHGVVGHLAMAGKTFLEAFQLFDRYMRIRTQLTDFDVVVTDNSVILQFNHNVDYPPLKKMLSDCALSGSYSLCRTFLETENAILKVDFDYPEPDDIQKYKDVFSCPLEFSQHAPRILIDLELISEASASGSDELKKISQLQCENLLNELQKNNSLADRVFTLLLSTPEYCFNQQELADCLAMSPRSLRRKLHKENICYRDLISQAQKQQAMGYFKSTNWKVEEIAYVMGYSDSSSFNKAFKRWFGKSVREYIEHDDNNTA